MHMQSVDSWRPTLSVSRSACLHTGHARPYSTPRVVYAIAQFKKKPLFNIAVQLLQFIYSTRLPWLYITFVCIDVLKCFLPQNHTPLDAHGDIVITTSTPKTAENLPISPRTLRNLLCIVCSPVESTVICLVFFQHTNHNECSRSYYIPPQNE